MSGGSVKNIRKSTEERPKMTSNPANNDDDTPKDPLSEMLANLMGGKGIEGIGRASCRERV